jgi:spermidine/putrescine transport system ATP-binding protein
MVNGSRPTGPSSPQAEETTSGPVLRLENITKSFDGTPVLEGVNLHVERGEFMAILGPSGCGKTTLLRIIAGLEVPDGGRVLLSGRDVAQLPASRRPVNTVFQTYALFPHLRVWENVAFGLKSRKLPAEEIRDRVQRALAMLQVEALAQRLPHQLSGGQKQRVALARALVNEPEVLLLDKPMSALDAKLRSEVQMELRRLQQRLGKTFILVTHDQDEAMTVSDRIVVMHQGRLEQVGRPREIYERPRSRFVAEFLGAANLIPAEKNGHAAQLGLETALGTLYVKREPEWNAGTLAIRPERVMLSDNEPERNGLRVTVREWVYRGDHLDIWVEPGALRLRVSPLQTIQTNQELWVHLPPEHLEVLVD